MTVAPSRNRNAPQAGVDLRGCCSATPRGGCDRHSVNTGGRGFQAEYSCPGGDPIDQTYTVGEDGHSLIGASPGAVAWQCYEPSAALRTESWRDARLLPQRSVHDIPAPPFSQGRVYCDTSAEIGRANAAPDSTVSPADMVFDHSQIDKKGVFGHLARRPKLNN